MVRFRVTRHYSLQHRGGSVELRLSQSEPKVQDVGLESCDFEMEVQDFKCHIVPSPKACMVYRLGFGALQSTFLTQG